MALRVSKLVTIDKSSLAGGLQRPRIYAFKGDLYRFDKAILVEFHHIDAGYPVVG